MLPWNIFKKVLYAKIYDRIQIISRLHKNLLNKNIVNFA